MTKDKYVVLINGPATSGKDTTAQMAMEMITEVPSRAVKFADPLRKCVCALLGIWDGEIEELKSVNIAAVDKEKFTVRDLMIALSEDLVKLKIEPDLFALRAADIIRQSADTVFFITDSGFNHEAIALMDALNNSGDDIRYSFAIWHIYRPLTSFDNDSRDWVSLPNVHLEIIKNYGTQESLRENVRMALRNTFLHHFDADFKYLP